MVVLGGVLFLISEVPLSCASSGHSARVTSLAFALDAKAVRISALQLARQGYLAQEKKHPPRTLP